MPLSLEATMKWCWVFVPNLFLELYLRAGCAKVTPKRVTWPDGHNKHWSHKWKGLHMYPVLYSPGFHSNFCYKQMPSSSSPCGPGKPTSHHEWLPQELARSNDDLTSPWLPNSCPPGTNLVQWPPGRRQTAPEGLGFPWLLCHISSLQIALINLCVLSGFKCRFLAPESLPKNQWWINESPLRIPEEKRIGDPTGLSPNPTQICLRSKSKLSVFIPNLVSFPLALKNPLSQTK